jgi:hypothetical protein
MATGQTMVSRDLDININGVIEAWREFTERVLMPAVNESGESLEGSIFCRCGESEYSDEFVAKQVNLAALAREAEARAPLPGPYALEVGFNAGFSAALLLLASPKMRLTCVDIGEHAYTRPCFERLSAAFPGRVNLVLGDSRLAVPMLRTTTGEAARRFDLVHVDGCHFPEVAALDVANCGRLAAPGAWVVMDDTDADFLMRVWLRESTRQCVLGIPGACCIQGGGMPPGFEPCRFHDVRRAARLAFYTVFCGPSGHAADSVLRPPSDRHPCYFFSNNAGTLDRASDAGWIAVDVSTECPLWADDVMSASQAKPFKAAPHRRPELARFDFTVYVDSKCTVDLAGAGAALDKLLTQGKALLIKRHPDGDVGVDREFNRAMTLPRYASQRHKIAGYINEMFELKKPDAPDTQAMSNALPNVWTTLVARDMRHPRCREVGEAWMRDIERCGIECQISAYFLRQTHDDAVVVDDSGDTPIVFDIR